MGPRGGRGETRRRAKGISAVSGERTAARMPATKPKAISAAADAICTSEPFGSPRKPPPVSSHPLPISVECLAGDNVLLVTPHGRHCRGRLCFAGS